MNWQNKHKDQMGKEHYLNAPPKRIISIVPSQTELLFDLNLESEVIGITKFCIHPDKWFKTKERIGGTKNLNIDKIRALKPDLIIGNKEENNLADIEILQKEFTVWMSDIFDLTDALEMIQSIGKMTNRDSLSSTLTSNISTQFESFATNSNLKKAVYLIWNNPIMSAGKDTFINEMLPLAGFENLILEERYPELTEEMIISLNPEMLLLSSEPFPFKEKHVIAFKKILPDAQIKIVDGEMFSWYGSRLLKAPEYFNSLKEPLQNR
ncbi:MAG: ABC-type Fe3+-hydroxamate transport system substrate-binding protein [Flavobacteriales bacterium]|jgi:ABC-type Fe3+-hydroxamate transport system substrate-binding protein